ncbi:MULTISPECIES: TIGR03619 family F420-dependent LLM class oxidoreductase [Pseudonocardia]|uniref:Phthiodiolone/phenolphthiodiolone dimycocerosates ketoreductase n=2 Tax=Pseudonocardia TaxID=1847 RepID=A0A1Y2MND1_PSEAH|nr:MULTISPECIES: TIGR03619 family F420-dependent LLM class oxidoreductase [Pseudonocardia]OSY36744.1 Phthiodiolone/phenolphthiodiolone dimycocerosates ketoreductase [Pseudonocardia autotrophica]TDN77141.1 putative F420-dependent oxidoreductase [Pseudonocardia autotrophica]BBG01146.1 LLM class F420-dependent oxidoreductase [Pseudonocardia autotrophica]GEC26798.1 LLM class F420-dependent oxidoreductase [Pseudonocardia saturnea]
MRIGFGLPQFGAAAARADETMLFAAGAEELGAASLWAGDRLLTAVEPSVGYGGTDTVPEQFRASLDPLGLLTAAAAVTTGVQLGTSTLNAPWYPPALLARHALTVDRLSGGRLLLGLGTGWSPEEYAAVGVPMARRGDRLDEALEVLDAWWNDDPVAHDGPAATIAPSHVQVKPHGIPVYLAGWAPRARRRIALHADGFLPVVTPQVRDLSAAVSAPWAELRAAAADAGRDPAGIDAVLRINLPPGSTTADAAATLRRVREDTAVPHAFVDLMYLPGAGAGGADALRAVEEILAAV